MKKIILFLFSAACLFFCCQPASTQPATNTSTLTDSENQPRWETIVYGEDWETEHKKIGQILPEFAAQAAIPPTEADKAGTNKMSVDQAMNITRAIEQYYLRLDKITLGYAGRKFEITATRTIDNYILLWLNEPEVYDGGRAIIYSSEKNKIVAAFFDGGIRG